MGDSQRHPYGGPARLLTAGRARGCSGWQPRMRAAGSQGPEVFFLIN